MLFSPRARRGSMWFSWPSVAHRLHGPPLKFMKSSSSLPPLRRVILHVRDFYYWNDTFMTARPRHTRAASWIISAKGGREMRYGRLSEARHLRSVAHHNMPISMDEKTMSLVLSWSSQKIMIWGGGGYERRLSGGLLRGRWGRRWIGGGGLSPQMLIVSLWTYSVRDSGIQSNIMQTSALWSCF